MVGERREARDIPNLSGGPGRQWRQRRRKKAREEVWVGLGGVWERERARGVQRGARRGSIWQGHGAPRAALAGARGIGPGDRWEGPGWVSGARGVRPGAREVRGGAGRGQRRASRVAREWPSRAVLGHATTGSKEREGGGGRPRSVSRTPRRPRGTRSRRPRSTGASGRGRLQCPGAL